MGSRFWILCCKRVYFKRTGFQGRSRSNVAQNGQRLSEYRRDSNRKDRYLPKGGHREGHSESRRCPLVGRRSPVDSAAGSFTPWDYGRKPIEATKKSE